MGCNKSPNERDDQMLEESARGENCISDSKILEEVRPEWEKIAGKELGLQKDELRNRELVEERIRERFIREIAKEDGLPYQVAFEKSSEEFVKEAEIRIKEYKNALSEGRANKIVEKIGVEGSEKLCNLMGYKPLLTDSQKGWKQGFDSVWQDPRSEKIVVVEAKGGWSERGMTKSGEPQGTLRWVYGAANRTLYSEKASEAEKETAKRVLKALPQGQVRIETIRVVHNEGVPKEVKIEKIEEVVPFSQKENNF